MFKTIARYFDMGQADEAGDYYVNKPMLKQGWSDYVVENRNIPPCPSVSQLYSRYTTDHYFEAHITLAPETGVKYDLLGHLADSMLFRVSKLYLKNSDGSVGAPWRDDIFISTREKNFNTIVGLVDLMIEKLREAGFTVRRYKIENILVDVKYGNKDEQSASAG